MSIGRKIREARRSKHLNQTDLAKYCGWDSQSRVSMYERGEREPAIEDIKKLAKALDKSVSWFVDDNVIDGPGLGRNVPLISWVRAGQWQEAIDNYAPGDGERTVPITINASAKTFALEVRGDSMEPTFPNGSIIIVDPEVESKNGSYVVARLDSSDEATFKQLVIDAGRMYLKPVNPRYPVIEVNGDMTICGVVKQMQINF